MPNTFNEIVERIDALKEQSMELWSRNNGKHTDEMKKLEIELDQLLTIYNELLSQAG